MAIDRPLFHFFNSFAGNSIAGDWVIIFFAQYAPFIFVLSFFMVVWRLEKDSDIKWRLFWVPSVASIIARLVIVPLVHMLWQRPRPFLILPIEELLSERSWSFPSGHASFLFALAFALYFMRPRWGWWFVIAASILSLFRVIAGVHWPSDVAGGLAVGLLTAYLMVKLFPTKNRP